MIFIRRKKGQNKEKTMSTQKDFLDRLFGKSTSLQKIDLPSDLKKETLSNNGQEIIEDLSKKNPLEETKEIPTSSQKEVFMGPSPKKKRGRPRNFPDISYFRKNMRLDVLNKSLIRAVKRELTQLFHQFIQDSGCFKSDKLRKDPSQRMRFQMPSKVYKEAIQKFAESIINWDADEYGYFCLEGLENLNNILGALIDPTKAGRELFPGTQKYLKEEIHNLCYSYSHIKLEEFLALPEIRFLLSKTLGPSYINTLLSKNKKLEESAELYKRCAALIIERIKKYNCTTEED